MGSALIFISDGIEYVTAANISDKENEVNTESYRFNINVRLTCESQESRNLELSMRVLLLYLLFP